MINASIAAQKAAEYLDQFPKLYRQVVFGSPEYANNFWSVPIEHEQQVLGSVFVAPDGEVNRVWSTNPIDIFRKISGTY